MKKRAIQIFCIVGIIACAFVGASAPALASALQFTGYLKAFQEPTYVRSGYRSSSADGALIKVNSDSQYGGVFWVVLDGMGQASSRVTVNKGGGAWAQYTSEFSANVDLYGHQVGWGPNEKDTVTGTVDFND